MDLKELENRNIEKQEPKQTTPKEPKQIKNSSTNQSYNSSRSNNDWMLILRLSVILALLVGLFIGSISGFFIGKAMFQGTQTTTPNDKISTNDDIFSQFDYSKIIIKNFSGEKEQKNRTTFYVVLLLQLAEIPYILILFY